MSASEEEKQEPKKRHRCDEESEDPSKYVIVVNGATDNTVIYGCTPFIVNNLEDAKNKAGEICMYLSLMYFPENDPSLLPKDLSQECEFSLDYMCNFLLAPYRVSILKCPDDIIAAPFMRLPNSTPKDWDAFVKLDDYSPDEFTPNSSKTEPAENLIRVFREKIPDKIWDEFCVFIRITELSRMESLLKTREGVAYFYKNLRKIYHEDSYFCKSIKQLY